MENAAKNENELQPMSTNACSDDDDEYYLEGKPYVPAGATMTSNAIAPVKSLSFMNYIASIFGSYNSNQWSKHMEEWKYNGNTYRYCYN